MKIAKKTMKVLPSGLDLENPEIRMLRSYLGAFGCQTHRIQSEPALLDVVRKAFDVTAATTLDAVREVTALGKNGRKARIAYAIYRWWGKPCDLWPADALARGYRVPMSLFMAGLLASAEERAPA